MARSIEHCQATRGAPKTPWHHFVTVLSPGGQIDATVLTAGDQSDFPSLPPGSPNVFTVLPPGSRYDFTALPPGSKLTSQFCLLQVTRKTLQFCLQASRLAPQSCLQVVLDKE